MQKWRSPNNSTDTTEVLVDATNGNVVSVETETPTQELEEQAADESAESDAWKPTLAPSEEPLTTTGRHPFFVLEPRFQLHFAGVEDGKPTELLITVLNETEVIDGVATPARTFRDCLKTKESTPLESGTEYK